MKVRGRGEQETLDNNKRKSRGIGKKDVLFPVSPYKLELPETYGKFLLDIKEKIASARLKTVLKANIELILLYWEIGRLILQKQLEEGWGAKVIDRLSRDLKEAFPDTKGFSPRNLKYMRSFAEVWPDETIVQRVVAQIPWRSNIALLDKLKSPEERLWYAKKTLEFGWSQPVLIVQIESNLYERTGKAITNFQATMPPQDSDMAVQVFKDPYIFDFLGMTDVRRETDLEQQLINHIQNFLLELGAGFAFVGRQVHLELGDSDFYLDLLFYHLKLRCYVVIELKAGEFKPGHVSQLGMYLSVVDDVLRHPDDKPTIGLLLVKQKNKLIAEYALRGYRKPMGIAEWETHITRSLPEELKPILPSIEEIEKELKDVEN